FLIDSLAKGKRSKGEPDFKALLGDNAGQFVAGAQATGDGIEIRLRTSAQSAPAPTGDAGKAADALPGNSIIAAAAVVSDTPALADRLDKSVFVGYLDVQRLVPTLGLSASERADIAPVKAVGVAVGVDGNAGTALIRVIIG